MHRRGIKTLLICSSVESIAREYFSEIINIIPTMNTKELSNTQYMISMQYILDVFVGILLVKRYEFVKEVGLKSQYYIKK